MRQIWFKVSNSTWIGMVGALAITGLATVNAHGFSIEMSRVPSPIAISALPPAAAAPLTNAFSKVKRYEEAFEHWQQSTAPQNFEPVLADGQEAAVAVLAASDDMDDVTFAQVADKMPGYRVSRDQIVIVAPDSAFLLEQSKKHGRPEDIAFFDLMGQTLNGYWPVTMEQLSDLSGCTRYGSHDLVRLYGAWKAFQKQYPNAYPKVLQDPSLLLLADIEDQLLNGQSACDGPESVIDELQTFISTYPQSDLTPKLKKRLVTLKSNQSNIAFFQGVKYAEPE